MKFLPFILALMFLVSCGKDSSSGSGSPAVGGTTRKTEAQAPNPPTNNSSPVDEEACALESCMTITSDGSSVDLLDSMIEAQASVTDTAITFTAPKSSVAQGERISCKTEVGAGEVYNIALNGSQLLVKGAGINMNMSRLNEDSEGLIGTWMWKGKGPGGMYMIKTMAIVSSNQVLLKTHCEL